MATQTPQFTPAGGEGSTYGNFTFTNGSWIPNQTPPVNGNGTSTNGIIVTGSNPANQFNQDSQTLSSLLAQLNTQPGTTPTNVNQPSTDTTIAQDVQTYSDPYTQMLDKIAANSDKATQNLIATIKTNKSNREKNINQEYDRLKEGLMSLGLSTDRMQYTPDLVYGSIIQAENQKASQLQQLDQQEATALLEAQQARDEKDFSLLKDRMDYIKSIKKTRLDLLKENYDTLSYQQKIGELQANQIYDQLQKLPESQKMQFMQAVATKFDIPLASLTSEVAKLAQTKKSSRSGGDYTSLELRKLRQAGIDPTDTVAADDFLYGESGSDNALSSILKQINIAYNNQNLVRNGKFTYEYIQNVLNNLPVGVTRLEFLKKVKDKLSLTGGYRRNAKNYGITKDEFNELTG